jgi:hypothetical protein
MSNCDCSVSENAKRKIHRKRDHNNNPGVGNGTFPGVFGLGEIQIIFQVKTERGQK